MPNADMIAIEAALQLLIDDSKVRAAQRTLLYEESLDQAERTWREASRVAAKYEQAVVDGVAPEWMQREYLLARFTMRKQQRVFKDRLEARAQAEIPGADAAPSNIAIDNAADAIE